MWFTRLQSPTTLSLNRSNSMTTYNKSDQSLVNYRKIYEKHYGTIPKDSDGRSYDIHHIDGNHNNNDISNLKAVTIQEHYDIHYAQGDYGACYCISRRLNVTPEEISAIARNIQLKLAQEGRHSFQLHRRSSEEQAEIAKRVSEKLLNNNQHPFQDKQLREKALIASLKVQKRLLEEGLHIFSNGELQRRVANERVKNGTHPLMGPNSNKSRLDAGTHPSQINWKCEHCNKVGKGIGNYKRHHGDRCKFKGNSD